MDENAVEVIAMRIIDEKIKDLNREIRDMKDKIDKIFVMFVAILTGIIVQIASALVKWGVI